MFYNYLADFVVVLHACFVLFVLLGGFLAVWKPAAAWLHVPAVLWAAGLEFAGLICPLTPLEIMLRTRGGETGYDTGFVEHYIAPILYPEALTRKMQVGLGLLVLVVNLVVYLVVWQRLRKVGRGQE